MFNLFLLIAILNLFTNSIEGKYDAVCGNSGFLINNYCSCNSGFGSSDCISNYTDTSVCNFDLVDPLNTIDPPAFNPAGSSFVNNNIILEIDSHIVSGRENFTVDFYGESDVTCGFPGPHWDQFADGSCNDAFIASLDWSFLRQNCGFNNPIDTVDSQNRPVISFPNSLNVQYDETITTPLTGTTTRHVQNSLGMAIEFMKDITVTSTPFDVNGTTVPTLQFVPVLIEQSYNATTGLGKLVYRTVVVWPYLLELPNIQPPSNIQADITDSTDYPATCQPGVVANGASNPMCVQTWTVILTPQPQLCSLTGLYKLDTNATCQSNVGTTLAMCPGMGLVTFQSNIQSSNFCPSLTFEAVLQGSLNAYTNDSYTTLLLPETPYKNGNQAFFMAEVTSPQATIENAWFVDVSIINSGGSNGQLCSHDTSYSNCINTVYGAANGFTADGKLAFSGPTPHFNFGIQVVNAGEPFGQFAGPNYPMFSLAANAKTTFTVQAQIMVQFQGNRRRLVKSIFEIEKRQNPNGNGASQQRAVRSTANAGIVNDNTNSNKNGDNNNSNSKNNNGNGNINNNGMFGTIIIAIGSILGVVVIGTVLLFVVIKRRNEKEENKSNSNSNSNDNLKSSQV